MLTLLKAAVKDYRLMREWSLPSATAVSTLPLSLERFHLASLLSEHFNCTHHKSTVSRSSAAVRYAEQSFTTCAIVPVRPPVSRKSSRAAGADLWGDWAFPACHLYYGKAPSGAFLL